MTIPPKCFSVSSNDGRSSFGQALVNTALCTGVCMMLRLAVGVFSVSAETLLLKFVVSVLDTRACFSNIKGILLYTLS